MIKGQKVLAIVPARGGSKGLVRKNLRLLGEKPLLAWTIEQARKSRYIDRLVLSSEDAEIIEVAKGLGCEVPFVRPAYLARDETPGIEPILHALSVLPSYEWIVMLQVTSPLRLASDIDGCIELCLAEGANAAVSLTEVTENPWWMYRLDADGLLDPLMSGAETPVRRQDLPEVLVLNGAVYVARSEWLKQARSFLTRETRGYQMPRERSLDIDTELDFKVVKNILEGRSRG